MLRSSADHPLTTLDIMRVARGWSVTNIGRVVSPFLGSWSPTSHHHGHHGGQLAIVTLVTDHPLTTMVGYTLCYAAVLTTL